MADITLTGSKRSIQGKQLHQLRQAELVPGVVYGQGKEATPVQVNHKLLEKVYQLAGHNQLVDFIVEGEQSNKVLFHEVQIDPMSRKIRHFDLYTVKMDEKIKTEVPIHFLSEAPAVHKLSAILVKNIEAIEVEALPANLPESVEVDLGGLAEIGQAIHVSDLNLPAEVAVLTEPETLVVKTDPPRSEEEMAELEEEVEAGAEAEVAAEHGEAEAETAGEGEPTAEAESADAKDEEAEQTE